VALIGHLDVALPDTSVFVECPKIHWFSGIRLVGNAHALHTVLACGKCNGEPKRLGELDHGAGRRSLRDDFEVRGSNHPSIVDNEDVLEAEVEQSREGFIEALPNERGHSCGRRCRFGVWLRRRIVLPRDSYEYATV